MLKDMGYEGTVEEFRAALTKIKAEHFVDFTDEELIFTRDEAGTYCSLVRKRLSVGEGASVPSGPTSESVSVRPSKVIPRSLIDRDGSNSSPRWRSGALRGGQISLAALCGILHRLANERTASATPASDRIADTVGSGTGEGSSRKT